MKSNKKGFTLIEIIIVLVIMTILASVAIPTVLGYIEDAKNSKYLEEGRNILLSSNAEVTKILSSKKIEDVDIQDMKDIILKKANVTGTLEEITTDNLSIDHFVYKIKDINKYVLYNKGKSMEIIDYYLPTSSNNGFQLLGDNPQTVKDFFNQGWTSSVDSNNVEFKYKVFTIDNQRYLLALSSKDKIDKNSLSSLKEADSVDEILRSTNGKYTTDNILENLSNLLGINSSERIDDIEINSDNELKINYK